MEQVIFEIKTKGGAATLQYLKEDYLGKPFLSINQFFRNQRGGTQGGVIPFDPMALQYHAQQFINNCSHHDGDRFSRITINEMNVNVKPETFTSHADFLAREKELVAEYYKIAPKF